MGTVRPSNGQTVVKVIGFLELREKLNNGYAALALFGNDGWVKRRAMESVRQVYDVKDDGFGIERLDAPSVDDIVYAASMPNMLGGKKVIFVYNFAFPQGRAQQEGKRKLSTLFKADNPTFCVVFDVDSLKTLDGVEGVEPVDCNKLDGASVVRWVVAYAKRQGVEVDRAAAQKLAEYCLCDMSRVATEAQKLVDYGKFDVTAVEMLVHKDMEYAVYDLSKLIAQKNVQRAMASYKGLLAQGEENRALFGLLYNFYRRVYYVKTSTELTEEQIAECLGVKRGAIGFAKDVAAKYKPMQLKRALSVFVDADAKLKAFVDEDEVMTALVFKLATI